MNRLIKDAINKPHFQIDLSEVDLCAIKIAVDRFMNPNDPEDQTIIKKVAIKWETFKTAVALHGTRVRARFKLTLSILEINLLKWALNEQVGKYKRDLESYHKGGYTPTEYEGNPFPETQKQRIINTLKVVQKITT